MNKIAFATFDPFVHDARTFCDICAANAPGFVYMLVVSENDGSETKGDCCGLCAPGLLRRLEYLEARPWKAEEAALKDRDILDKVESVG